MNPICSNCGLPTSPNDPYLEQGVCGHCFEPDEELFEDEDYDRVEPDLGFEDLVVVDDDASIYWDDDVWF
jgi:hypothetical protein